MNHAPLKWAILRQLPSGVWVTGVVSMLTDISLEMVHTILPLFMVGVLGASVMAVGFIEGVADSLSHILKVFSGSLSDYWGRRKPLVVLGYSMNIIAKPVMAMAGSVGLVFLSRFIDRVGRGIRAAPRDAMMAEITPKHLMGASFGLGETLVAVGQILGPLIAFILLYFFQFQFQTIFWLATIPAIMAVVILVLFLHEPQNIPANDKVAKKQNPLHWHQLQSLGAPFWWLVVFGGFLMLARFADAFLLLRAYNLGLQPYQIPLLMILWNVGYALSAYPAGKLADGRLCHKHIMLLGVLFLALCDIFLALADNWAMLVVGAVFWGLHIGFTQGLINTMIAGVVPPKLLGTAFGFFNLVRGVGVLGASSLAGIIWVYYGPQATFLVALLFVVIALLSMGKLQSTNS